MSPCIHGEVCREYLRQRRGIICRTCPKGCSFYEPKERTCHIAEAFHEMALELADARTELERQRRLSSIDRERAEMVSQLEDENLEFKKRLGFFGDLTPPVSWYAAMREENERLNRELMEAMR